MRRFLLPLFLALAAAPSAARAVCNLIPSADRAFPSTLGEASTPYASPGQIVTVRRETPVFALDPAGNEVRVEFVSVAAPTVAVPASELVAPAPGATCAPDACSGGLCTCLSFRFPDTDALAGAPGDALTLSGPANLLVETGGIVTARIDRLRIPGSGFRDDVFPSFVALPPPNRVEQLVATGPSSGVRAAVDDTGNLFFPLDFSGLAGLQTPLTRFVEVKVPAFDGVDGVEVDAFTTDGRRLPPLIRQIAGADFIGTADGPASVLRIEAGARLADLDAVFEHGPVLVPGVSVHADPAKRADGITLEVNERFAVFENRECGALDPPDVCLDVNGDGDRTDRFLLALDLETPGADPVPIDTLDERDFPGAFPSFNLYAFSASDDLVAWRIPEASAFDLDADGSVSDLIRSGAFDLRRGVPVPLSGGTPRAELDGSLLAFSVTVEPTLPLDSLLVYDAASATPGPFVVSDGVSPQLFVSRFPAGSTNLREHPFDLDVDGDQVAFAVVEPFVGRDLTGDGLASTLALLVFDRVVGGVLNPQQPVLQGLLSARGRRLAFQGFPPSGGTAVGLLARDRLADPPSFACADAFGLGFTSPSFSDSLVPCTKGEGLARDLNGDGDTIDDDVLHVLLPEAPGGPEERNLGLALFTQFGPRVRGDSLVFAADETSQGEDLDGDGQVGSGAFGVGPFVLHAFHGRTGELVNFQRDVAVDVEPFFERTDDGLVFISSDLVRTLFRDIDRDGHFEELFTDPATGRARLADNCPRDANPDQTDTDGDGLGDACDPDAFCAGIAAGPCRVEVSDPPSVHDDLQHAVDAARDGALLRVHGVCPGPVRVVGRRHLTLAGVPPPPGVCSDTAPGALDLSSTVSGGRHAVEVLRSRDVRLEFLNLVGAREDGLRAEGARDVSLRCACTARNGGDGLRLDRSRDLGVDRVRVARNEGRGIRLRRVDRSAVERSIVRDNAGDGLVLHRSDRNRAVANRIERNGSDGVGLVRAHRNRILENRILRNGTRGAADAGVELLRSGRNRIEGNRIRANADARIDEAVCLAGARRNTGDNVPSGCGRR